MLKVQRRSSSIACSFFPSSRSLHQVHCAQKAGLYAKSGMTDKNLQLCSLPAPRFVPSNVSPVLPTSKPGDFLAAVFSTPSTLETCRPYCLETTAWILPCLPCNASQHSVTIIPTRPSFSFLMFVSSERCGINTPPPRASFRSGAWSIRRWVGPQKVYGDALSRVERCKSHVGPYSLSSPCRPPPPALPLVPFQGGFKLWEGAVDLVNAVQEEVQQGRVSFRGRHVLEVMQRRSVRMCGSQAA